MKNSVIILNYRLQDRHYPLMLGRVLQESLNSPPSSRCLAISCSDSLNVNPYVALLIPSDKDSTVHRHINPFLQLNLYFNNSQSRHYLHPCFYHLTRTFSTHRLINPFTQLILYFSSSPLGYYLHSWMLS